MAVRVDTPDDVMVCYYACCWQGLHCEAARVPKDVSACPKCGEVAHLDVSGTRMPSPSYIRIKSGEVAKVTEAVPGIVFLDWDEAGNLLGVEVLPVEPLAKPPLTPPPYDLR